MAKKSNWLSICFIVQLGILVVLSCISSAFIFSGHMPQGEEVISDAQRTASLFTGFAYTVNEFAMICGIIYWLRGRGKDSSRLYKAFMLQVTIGMVLRLIGKIIYPGFDVSAVLMICSSILLLILTFVPDLGRIKTWAIYCAVLALEIAVAILVFDAKEAFSSIAFGLTRLALVGTIGFAIRSKYEDKAARGK